MSGTTKLRLFNGALLEMGERPVDDTGDAPRALPIVYDQVVEECLAVGSWNFAMETVSAAADTGVEPSFGYTEVFAKPTDWIRTIAVSVDENFNFPLLRYYDDANFWSADTTPLYVRYVSSDTGLGLELTRWPSAFARYAELELSARTCFRITQSAKLTDIIAGRRDKARRRALNEDAMDEAQPKFAPSGSWTMARRGQSGRGDRGRRNNLTE